jgi:hypothetical protein
MYGDFGVAEHGDWRLYGIEGGFKSTWQLSLTPSTIWSNINERDPFSSGRNGAGNSHRW